MKTIKFLFSFLFLLLFVSFLKAQTVEEIYQKYSDTMGGKTAWDAVKSLKATGYATMGGMDFAFTQTSKRPNKVLLEIIIQGMTMKQVYDGTTAWMINPFSGSKKPEKVDEDMARQFKNMAKIGGELLNYVEYGDKIELLGKEDYEGTQVYKVKLVETDGTEITYFLDAEKFTELKTISKLQMSGKEIESTTIYSNYKDVNGLKIPFTMEIKTKGGQTMGDGQTIRIDKVETNVDVEDAIFVMPAE